MKKVSVIIPVYNGERFIADAIKSVLAQRYKSYEIIVVNDGSTDKTEEILKKYMDKIKYIYQKNQGVAVARNIGIKASNGKYIAFLDADDTWIEDRLGIGVEILNNEPDIDLVHANDIKVSKNNIPLRGYTRKKRYLNGYLAKKLILRKIHIQLSTVLFRRKCLKKIGLFDPQLSKLGVEDREFFYRLTKHCKAKYVDKDVSYYRVLSDGLSSNRKKMLAGHKYAIDKHFPKKKGINITRSRILSALYLDEGIRISWKTTDYNSAIKEFYRAIKYYPFNFLVYFHLLKTILKKLLH